MRTNFNIPGRSGSVLEREALSSEKGELQTELWASNVRLALETTQPKIACDNSVTRNHVI